MRVVYNSVNLKARIPKGGRGSKVKVKSQTKRIGYSHLLAGSYVHVTNFKHEQVCGSTLYRLITLRSLFQITRGQETSGGRDKVYKSNGIFVLAFSSIRSS